MRITIGFDVYGTLIDTHGVVVQLETMIGDGAQRFSQLWREKQLEYTWRRGLMKNYVDFGVCTRQALDYAADFLGHALSDAQKLELIQSYSTLPAFEDVVEGLTACRHAGYGMYAFSNGQAEGVQTVLENAGIREYFDGVVSVDAIGTFKPDPDTYAHFVEATDTNMDNAWLVSSNGFDVIGAVSYGIRAAWIQRSPVMVFDHWEHTPTVVLDNLSGISGAIG